MRSFFKYSGFAVLSALCLARAVAAETVITNLANEPKEQLALSVLKLALSKSMPGARFQSLPQFAEQARAVEYIKEGKMTVMWAGTKPEYEQELIPVRIPIEKGMLGYRIFIIRKGDQPKFDQVKSLEDLKKLRAGQGRFWGDTAVLKAANLPVVTPVKYPNLFPMLEGGRFDYFPRAVHEPWSEVEQHKALNLEVEKHILLVYPFAMYFFVSKDKPQLAEAIRSGFETAIKDGSYDKLFYGNPLVANALAQSRLKDRLVIRIPNPYMSAQTPTNRPELWLNISKY
ncbi:transporter substrate-binding domain-containing protein [Paludibacterium yongneupense]|uniref:transporter substrate-binding domain-containing protein n=1 Tax=Paludibacterium yongneupense TaxID=400061 RepID=UPI00041A960B|nr:transporter substrate-binding domain-containing protein [Paludibacterium yongneupense]